MYLDDLSKELEISDQFYKFEIANLSTEDLQVFGINTIPTTIFLKNREVIDQWAGTLPKYKIRDRIKNNLF